MPNNNKRAAKNEDSSDSGENIEDHNNNGTNQGNDNNQVVENGPTTSKRPRLDAEIKDNKPPSGLFIRRSESNTKTKIAFKSPFYSGRITFGGNASNCIPNLPLRATNPGLQPLGGDQLRETYKLPFKSDFRQKPEETQTSEVNLTGLSSTTKKIYNMIKDQEHPSDKQKFRFHPSIADISETATTFRQNSELWKQAFNCLRSTQPAVASTQNIPRTFLFDTPLPLPPARERERQTRVFTFEAPIGLEEDFKNYLNDQAGIANGVDSLFSENSTEWECETCFMRNPESRQQCVVCEAAKPVPGASPSAEKSLPSPEVQLGVNLKTSSSEELDIKSSSTDYFPSPVASYDFTKTISKKWKCSMCHAENNVALQACIFCETLKPQSNDD